jgi:hypothetical protein
VTTAGLSHSAAASVLEISKDSYSRERLQFFTYSSHGASVFNLDTLNVRGPQTGQAGQTGHPPQPGRGCFAVPLTSKLWQWIPRSQFVWIPDPRSQSAIAASTFELRHLGGAVTRVAALAALAAPFLQDCGMARYTEERARSGQTPIPSLSRRVYIGSSSSFACLHCASLASLSHCT